MPVEACLEAALSLGVAALCLTNHGEIADYRELSRLAPLDLIVIPGVEISAPEGDFLLYSQDFDFLESLEAVQPLPASKERPDATAVVWAHPFAGNPGGRNASEEYISSVAIEVDGIEVYNGNWPDDEASELARRVAGEYELGEMGGSDAHKLADMMRCWTEVGGGIGSVADLIAAIKDRRTTARKSEST